VDEKTRKVLLDKKWMKMYRANKYYFLLEELMNSNELPYIIEQHYNCFDLYVKMNEKQHLEITVFNNSFQKTTSFILETIQQYKNLINNSQIELLLKNPSSDSYLWINQKKNERNKRPIIAPQIPEIQHVIRLEINNFLNKKLRKIVKETQLYNPKLDLTLIKKEKVYKVSHIHFVGGNTGCTGFSFSAIKNCLCCYLLFKGKAKRTYIRIEFNGYRSFDMHGTIGALYRCLDELYYIAEETLLLMSGFKKQEKLLFEKQAVLFEKDTKRYAKNKKQEKIEEISINSIHTWITAMMSNLQYTYYTVESRDKITLSMLLKDSKQLDIPIYYNNFHKIIPDLLETIQKFENAVKNSKIEVLINNNNPNQQWKTNQK